MSNFLGSKKIRTVLVILGSLIVLLLAFGLGMRVGNERAMFASGFEQDYYRNFGISVAPGGAGGGVFLKTFGPPPPMMGVHGIAGTVIDVMSSTIALKDPMNNEQWIDVLPVTLIREANDTITITGIRNGDTIAAIGEPDEQGHVEARFIRVFADGSSTAPVIIQNQSSPSSSGQEQEAIPVPSYN